MSREEVAGQTLLVYGNMCHYADGMKHRDALLIDRIGFDVVVAHFDCSETIVRRWRRKGIPRMHVNTFTLLARLHGVTQ